MPLLATTFIPQAKANPERPEEIQRYEKCWTRSWTQAAARTHHGGGPPPMGTGGPRLCARRGSHLRPWGFEQAPDHHRSESLHPPGTLSGHLRHGSWGPPLSETIRGWTPPNLIQTILIYALPVLFPSPYTRRPTAMQPATSVTTRRT